MDTWSYRDSTWVRTGSLLSYDVEAVDGSIGTVDDATDELSGSYLVVDAGTWILGTKRLVPAGAVTAVDHDSRKVRLAMTRDQVKNGPDYDGDTWGEESRAAHQDYYFPFSQ